MTIPDEDKLIRLVSTWKELGTTARSIFVCLYAEELLCADGMNLLLPGPNFILNDELEPSPY
jgi:hypothetical protein